MVKKETKFDKIVYYILLFGVIIMSIFTFYRIYVDTNTSVETYKITYKNGDYYSGMVVKENGTIELTWFYSDLDIEVGDIVVVHYYKDEVKSVAKYYFDE